MIKPPKEKMGSKASSTVGDAKIYGKWGEMMPPPPVEEPMPKQVLDSTREIWLAGLGAFSRVHDEGKKIFDTLVRQGEKIEHRSRHIAETGIETVREQASKTLEIANNKFDNLEQMFESRVHKSLSRLGVLTQKDIEPLSQQVAALSEAVHNLLGQAKHLTEQAQPPRPAKKPAKKITKTANQVVKAPKTSNAPKTDTTRKR